MNQRDAPSNKKRRSLYLKRQTKDEIRETNHDKHEEEFKNSYKEVKELSYREEAREKRKNSQTVEDAKKKKI